MARIKVRRVDESYIALEPDEEAIIRELDDYFSFKKEGAQYSKLTKSTVIMHPDGTKETKPPRWDGKTHLFSTYTGKIYAGLLRHVQLFAEQRKYECEIEDGLGVFNNYSLAEAKEDMTYLNLPVDPHDYQVMGLAKAIRYKRMLLVSPTASGKSLMIYAIARHLVKLGRGVIIVPTQNLVEQLYGDFEAYAIHDSGWVEKHCQRLYEGHSKNVIKPILITTWQSFLTQPDKHNYDWVIGDEAHGFKAESLKEIMTDLTNAKYRIGTTGTTDNNSKVHRLIIEGHFGPYSKLATTKELQDRGIVAKSKIKALILKHGIKDAQAAAKLNDWNMEMDYLITHGKRNRFIANLTKSLRGNVLILFNYEDHGKILEQALSECNKQVYLVYGKTDVDAREEVRKIAEVARDCVIVASYGVYSTGVNIKNIPHLILASSTKSKIRLLQSKGRGLRLHEDKEFLTVYDIADDLRWKTWVNHTLKQWLVRLNIYKEEGWEVSKYIIDIG